MWGAMAIGLCVKQGLVKLTTMKLRIIFAFHLNPPSYAFWHNISRWCVWFAQFIKLMQRNPMHLIFGDGKCVVTTTSAYNLITLLMKRIRALANTIILNSVLSNTVLYFH